MQLNLKTIAQRAQAERLMGEASHKDEFDDVPGTYLFNRHRGKQGYWLNMFCMSLMTPENRAAFLGNEDAYLANWKMSPEQKAAVRNRDWLGMIKLGGNIYYLSKLGATDGKSFQYMAGAMSGLTQEQYRDMMVKGGRPIDGNRSKAEQAAKREQK